MSRLNELLQKTNLKQLVELPENDGNDLKLARFLDVHGFIPYPITKKFPEKFIINGRMLRIHFLDNITAVSSAIWNEHPDLSNHIDSIVADMRKTELHADYNDDQAKLKIFRGQLLLETIVTYVHNNKKLGHKYVLRLQDNICSLARPSNQLENVYFTTYKSKPYRIGTSEVKHFIETGEPW